MNMQSVPWSDKIGAAIFAGAFVPFMIGTKVPGAVYALMIVVSFIFLLKERTAFADAIFGSGLLLGSVFMHPFRGDPFFFWVFYGALVLGSLTILWAGYEYRREHRE